MKLWALNLRRDQGKISRWEIFVLPAAIENQGALATDCINNCILLAMVVNGRRGMGRSQHDLWRVELAAVLWNMDDAEKD